LIGLPQRRRQRIHHSLHGVRIPEYRTLDRR
jgi:hypothetical protein